MKRFILITSVFLIAGCGHNRYNEFKTWGVGVSIPFGDLGALSVNVGSSQSTVAMVRGGSSFTTESAEGAGLFAGSGGSARATTFKSNIQLNEGNLRKVLDSQNTPEAAKIIIASNIAAAATAPEVKPSALRVREAALYNNGFTNEIHPQFDSTGVDKMMDTVDNAVNNAAGMVNNLTSNTIGTIGSTVNTTVDTGHKVVRTVVDGTASVSRSWAISTLISAIAGIIGMIFAAKKTTGNVKSKLKKKFIPSPPPLDGEENEEENKSEEPAKPVEEEDEEDEEEPLDPKAPWWKKLFRWLVGLFTSAAALWKSLPDETQESIKGKASGLFKKRKRKI